MAKNENKNVVEETKVEAPVVGDTVTESTPVIGVVSNCSRLNIRKKAGIKSPVVRIVDRGKEVIINESKSTEKWFNVTTRDKISTTGFCMKEYIKIK